MKKQTKKQTALTETEQEEFLKKLFKNIAENEPSPQEPTLTHISKMFRDVSLEIPEMVLKYLRKITKKEIPFLEDMVDTIDFKEDIMEALANYCDGSFTEAITEVFRKSDKYIYKD